MTKTEATVEKMGSERTVTVSNAWGNSWVVTLINCGNYHKGARVNYLDGQPVKVGSDDWDIAIALALRAA